MFPEEGCSTSGRTRCSVRSGGSSPASSLGGRGRSLWCSSGSCSRTSCSRPPCSSSRAARPLSLHRELADRRRRPGRHLVQRPHVLPQDARHAELRERVVLVLRGRSSRSDSPAWWLLQGNPASTDFGTGWDPFQGETLALGLPANLTFFSFAILALLGSTPLNMGAEVTGGEKAIRTFLLWGCAIVMAAYLWATWGNMV